MCAFPSQLDVTSNTWRGPNSQTLHAAEIKFHARRRGGGGGEFVVGLTVGSRMRDEEEEEGENDFSLVLLVFKCRHAGEVRTPRRTSQNHQAQRNQLQGKGTDF